MQIKMKLVNEIYTGANGRQSLVDLEEPEFYYEDIVLFIHGFKGYKDWGAWNLVQKYFVVNDVAFCKFNMSHNGGTINQPYDFPDLEAFSKNTYSYEIEDVQHILDWLAEKIDISNKQIHLIGHSRGGGIALLVGSDERIMTITTWAGISDIESRFPTGEQLEDWKNSGVRTIENSRTKQQMPIKYSLYEDWQKNKEKLFIEKAAKSLNKPTFHIHGDKDESVSITCSESLSLWTHGTLIVINKANHTFNTYQPFEEAEVPNKLNEACILTLNFINNYEESKRILESELKIENE